MKKRKENEKRKKRGVSSRERIPCGETHENENENENENGNEMK